MKKLLLVLVSIMLVFILVACGTAEVEDTRTIDHFLQAFEVAGYEVLNPRPSVIGGGEEVDSVMFNIMLDRNVAVFIYQFDDEEALIREQRFEERTGGGAPNMVRNGMFLMRTNPQGRTELNEVFLAVEIE